MGVSPALPGHSDGQWRIIHLLLLLGGAVMVQGQSGWTGANVTLSAFNIQVFGQSKISKPEVVTELVRICRRYDLIAVQEIRDAAQTAIHTFVQRLNQGLNDVESYNVTVGTRQGRSSSKEQYAYLYRASKLRLRFAYDYHDPNDVFEREPYIGLFTILQGSTELLNMSLIVLHSKPADVVSELNALPQVFEESVQRTGTNNSIIFGDFNADCSYLSNSEEQNLILKQDENDYIWLIGDSVDTTVKSTNCAYDRIIVTRSQLFEYVVQASARPFDFESAYDLSLDLAEDVSDHYPVELKIQVPVSNAINPSTLSPTSTPTPPPMREPTSSPTILPQSSSANSGSGNARLVEVWMGVTLGIVVTAILSATFYFYRKGICDQCSCLGLFRQGSRYNPTPEIHLQNKHQELAIMGGSIELASDAQNTMSGGIVV
mmetsp:Transcript_6421/g.15518  ORF Transcript_6421/g.15518 Transcript_6421/m.15518 type:complete len:431 (+) Transcript_6421:213-1505(+)